MRGQLDAATWKQVFLWLRRNRDHAFICMDAGGTITAWLGAAEELLGWRADEIVGRNLAHIFTPEDRARAIDSYELGVARADSRSEDDRWHLRKDGTRIWATGAVSAVRDEAGHLLGFIKVMRDRTDLRAQIERLESEAVAMRDSRTRTHQFLQGLGHELRNPLAPLSAATQLIRRLNPGNRVEDALQIIERQLAALTRLADDLMDITRLETGKMEFRPVMADLRLFLAQAVVSLQDAASAKKLRLDMLMPPTPLEVSLDESRFQRLVLNLLGNAIKYTPENGTVWVKAVQEGDEIVFRVEDTGIGIAPEVLPRIFELFTQESAAARVAPRGLAMVREIAHMHGASVQARSAGPGKGAEFTVRLPVRQPVTAPADMV